MFAVWLVVAIAQSMGDPTAIAVWSWFGHHTLLTILMILLLA